jgi:hypothetical protein
MKKRLPGLPYPEDVDEDFIAALEQHREAALRHTLLGIVDERLARDADAVLASIERLRCGLVVQDEQHIR